MQNLESYNYNTHSWARVKVSGGGDVQIAPWHPAK